MTRAATLNPAAKPSPDFSHEDNLTGSSALACAGLDEVGRGPLAGPVVAAACVLDRARLPDSLRNAIKDSKKLTARKRANIAAALGDYSDISIGLCEVAEIDTMNILRASLEAMARAYRGLSSPPAFALVDGNQKPPLGTVCRLQTLVGGDAKSLSVAAASIVAKEYRDTLMRQLAESHPVYGWERNAGYGTASHLQAIELYGVTIHHRRSFAPISKHIVKVSSANN